MSMVGLLENVEFKLTLQRKNNERFLRTLPERHDVA